ncbi:FkbM family methyltransferase [Dokdonia sp. Hel_I_53]|uniref:FkbM family methyltransferase n=1 Tax=Dokdonia sp. Hel_I_53 TaxID=1566287 RepID=UPI00119AF5BC|nr:FkbM family methyltransferase [Dokdonia sp. Hel_I_53]TVZ53382.1 FkbM family methyltransferase [Dokdonia sp. Hel_I_53]
MNIHNLRYRLAKKIGSKLQKYASNRNATSKKNIEKVWTSKFINSNFFEHNLEEGIKINLYEDSILSQYIYNGFEELELNFVKKNLSTGDTFLDIGSNVGLFSLVASKAVGDRGSVIAFEPNPETYRRLQENIDLNNFHNITTHNIGLSDRKNTLDFFISDTGFDAWNSFAPEPSKLQNVIKVDVLSLDKFLEKFDKEKIKLIKIDVEGWEKFVLKGGESFLNNYNPILIIEFGEENTLNANYHVQELFGILESYGYKWYDIQKDLTLISHKKVLNYPYSNLIAKKN